MDYATFHTDLQAFTVRFGGDVTGFSHQGVGVPPQQPPSRLSVTITIRDPFKDGRTLPPNTTTTQCLVYGRSSSHGGHVDIYTRTIQNLSYAFRWYTAAENRHKAIYFISVVYNINFDATDQIPGTIALAREEWRPFFAAHDTQYSVAMPATADSETRRQTYFLVRGWDGLSVHPEGLVQLIHNNPTIRYEFWIFQVRHYMTNYFIDFLDVYLHNQPPNRSILETDMKAFCFPEFTGEDYMAGLGKVVLAAPLAPEHAQGQDAVDDMILLWRHCNLLRAQGDNRGFNINRNMLLA